VAVAPGGGILAVACEDGTVRIYSTAVSLESSGAAEGLLSERKRRNKELASDTEGPSSTSSAAVTSNEVVGVADAAHSDANDHVFDVCDGSTVETDSSKTDFSSRFALRRKPKLVRELAGPDKPITRVAYNSVGTRLLAICEDGTARVWRW
jgi:WD40 repeat protein